MIKWIIEQNNSQFPNKDSYQFQSSPSRIGNKNKRLQDITYKTRQCTRKGLITFRLRDSPVSLNPGLFLEQSQLNSILCISRVVTCTIMWFTSNEAAVCVTWRLVKSRLFGIKNNCSSLSGRLLNKVFNNNLVLFWSVNRLSQCCPQKIPTA